MSKPKTTSPHTPHVSVPKKPRQWPALLAVTKYATIAALRNKATVAFGFIFPLVFISVFGLLGNSTSSVRLGIPTGTIDNPISKAVADIPLFKITSASEDELQEQLQLGELDAVLEVTTKPDNQGLNIELQTSQANPQMSGTATTVISSIVDKTNLQLSNITDPPISFNQQQVDGQEQRYIDFALPGMIGFSLLGTALFGTVFGLITLKKTLVLKRMFATPTKPLTFLAGQGFSRLLFALAQTAVIIGVGVVAFKFNLPHGWLTLVELFIITSLGLIAFLGFGYFMAGFANDENSAGPLVNLVTLPQFLLSGVFFPSDSFPEWVRIIASFLPLSFFNEAIRTVTTHGGTLFDTIPYLIGLMVWGALMYILAAKTFRWE